MTITLDEPLKRSKIGDPTWELVNFFPRQGQWTESQYLALEGNNSLIELNDGVLEILPAPNALHQAIALWFGSMLMAFSEFGKLGTVLCAPLRLKIADKKFREPDVLFLLAENDGENGLQYWTGADLVVEIISEGGRRRDEVEKRADYALAGISEYWIIDPDALKVTVLRLSGKKYVKHGEFKKGEQASSALLKDFKVDVTKLFATGGKHRK